MFRRFLVLAVLVGAVGAAGLGLGVRGAEAAQNPGANAGGPYVGAIGQVVTFNGSGSVGTNLTFVWHFGDGATGTGVVVSHVYSTPGTYYVILTVTDVYGNYDTTNTSAFIGGFNTTLFGTNFIGQTFVGQTFVGSNNGCVLTAFGPSCGFGGFVGASNLSGFFGAPSCIQFGFVGQNCFFVSPATGAVIGTPLPGALACPIPQVSPYCRSISQ